MAKEKIVNIYRARPIIVAEEVPKVTIRILNPLPDISSSGKKDWEKEYRDMYTREAGELADALCHSLPGGTIDALLVKLLDEKRSLFSVPLYVKAAK